MVLSLASTPLEKPDRLKIGEWLESLKAFSEDDDFLTEISKVSKAKIGEGTYGKVYDFLLPDLKSDYVIKHISPTPHESKVINEIKFHQIASKVNIAVPFFGGLIFNLSNGNYAGYIVSKKATCDMHHYVNHHQSTGTLSLDNLVQIIFMTAVQLTNMKSITGLDYTDLKLENVLITTTTEDELEAVNLTDFEFLGNSHFGTIEYADPTHLKVCDEDPKNNLDKKNTWALMVMTLNSLSGRLIFYDKHLPSSIEAIEARITRRIGLLPTSMNSQIEKIQKIALDTLTFKRADRPEPIQFALRLISEIGSEPLLKKLGVITTVPPQIKSDKE